MAFTNPNNLRDILQDDCERILGCGVPIHRFRLNGALKNKWLNSGIFEGDKHMEHQVNLNKSLLH